MNAQSFSVDLPWHGRVAHILLLVNICVPFVSQPGFVMCANQHVVSICCKQVFGSCVLPGACLHSMPQQPDCVPGRAEEWEGGACG